MSTIADTFQRLRNRNERAFIPFVTAGDPDLDTTADIVRRLIDSGADIIEIGVPFSDPMADGPTIQAASERALRNPFSLKAILEMIGTIRAEYATPIILFGYYNPFMRYGIECLAEDAAAAGVDALLIVDLPPEEAGPMLAAARPRGLDMIFLLAPTSTEERIQRITACASGFIYFVSVTGVTGTRASLDGSLQQYVDTIRRYTELPVGIGFGVSTPDQVSRIAVYADAVIVGSAIVNIIAAHAGKDTLLDAVGDFASRLKAATRATA
jgi:tryptophan synthase alpha chain